MCLRGLSYYEIAFFPNTLFHNELLSVLDVNAFGQVCSVGHADALQVIDSTIGFCHLGRHGRHRNGIIRIVLVVGQIHVGQIDDTGAIAPQSHNPDAGNDAWGFMPQVI